MSQPPRLLTVRVAFEPNRFAPENLMTVYEHLKPTASRTAVMPPVPLRAPPQRSHTVGGQS
jgi:hypothetical protein